MSTIEQSVTLLRRNKRALASALQGVGFSSVTEATRMSMVPSLIKWAHGLLDVNVACRRKRDGKHYYFTVDEWQSLSATEQATMLVRGIRLRANGLSIIVSLMPAGSVVWSGQASVPIMDEGMDYAYRECVNERYDTETIQKYFSGQTLNNVEGSPAATLALSYRAWTDDEGFSDETQWCLMSVRVALVIYRYKQEINAVLTKIGGQEIGSVAHWTCNSIDSSTSYSINMGYGAIAATTKSSGSCTVRPIAVENN